MQDLIGFLNHLMNSPQLHSINPKNNIKIRSWDISSENKIDYFFAENVPIQNNYEIFKESTEDIYYEIY